MRTVKTWLATIAMLLCSISVNAHNFEVDGVYYNFISKQDKTVEVTYKGHSYNDFEEYSGCITLSENVTFDGVVYSVKGIGQSAFNDCTKLTSITIPNSVTNIGAYAFRYCTQLTSITIPNSVTNIDHEAFYGCFNLISITIPSSVINIGNDAFDGCNKLPAEDYVRYADKWAVGVTDKKVYSCVLRDNTEGIANIVFSGCSNLYSITIPSSVKSIGSSAFNNCSALSRITIPSSVTSINDCTFRYCSALRDITIPNSVTSIGYEAFGGCSALRSITIPSSVTSIGNYAFSACSNLYHITIPSSVRSIGYSAFDGCELLPIENYIQYAGKWAVGVTDETQTAYILRDNTVGIAGNTFRNCSNLTSITIPNSVTSIGNGAFEGCSALSGITIPNSVTNIGGSAFSNCSNLTSITIPNSVTNIGGSAFSNCSNLTSITIPNSVTNIGDYAFGGCSTLRSITIPNSVTNIGGSAFSNCSNLTSITIPNSVINIGDYAFYGCSKLSSIIIPSSVTNIGGSAFSNCSNLTSITIPNSVINIGDYAFENCSKLSSITIPSSVTRIFENTFTGCSMLPTENYIRYADKWAVYVTNKKRTTYVLRDNTEGIADMAFFYCSNFTSITIPNSVTSIGRGAFCDCDNLTSIIIPNSITRIEEQVFIGCGNLTSITIPSSVISIGSYAFEACYKLNTITCYNPTPPTCGIGAWGNATYGSRLMVPTQSVAAYSATEPWSSFANIVALPPEISLIDGVEYENNTDEDMSKITYTRTLPNLQWNALFVPFEIPVSELADDYDVAYINDIHSYDKNLDGEIDQMEMEVIYIKEGTLHANHPYLIRAKSNEAKAMNIVVTDATLYSSAKADRTSITCSSAYTDFEVIGTYEKMTAQELGGCYAINTSGAWSPIASGASLNPFRLYMTITSRNGSPVKVSQSAMSRINIRVQGEDTETGIGEIVNDDAKAEIYDMTGRRLQNAHKGIYIINGKKVFK